MAWFLTKHRDNFTISLSIMMSHLLIILEFEHENQEVA
jgi:hypothetical protein